MKLVTFKETPIRLPRSRIRKLFEMIVEEEADPEWPAQVNLVLTTDSRVRQLNREFRAKDMATDVLSFNVDAPEQKDGVFGEIYIATPYVRRQAAKVGRTHNEELLLLICHGLLHLLGHDHSEEAEAKKMEARQTYFLDRLTSLARGRTT